MKRKRLLKWYRVRYLRWFVYDLLSSKESCFTLTDSRIIEEVIRLAKQIQVLTIGQGFSFELNRDMPDFNLLFKDKFYRFNFKQLTNLVELNLFCCILRKVGAEILANGNLTRLVRLNLGGTSLGNGGVSYLVKGNFISLVSLELKGNWILEEGAKV